MKKYLFTVFALLFVTSSALYSQRRGEINYITLANRASAPNFFFDELILPGSNDDEVQLAFIFRMDNNFLPFKKISPDDEIQYSGNNEFYSIAQLNADIFQGKASRKKLENSFAISQDIWADTVFAATFDDTKSNKKYASGKLITSLEPGMYNYVLQLSVMESTRERNSNRRNVMAQSFSTKKTGEIYLLKDDASGDELALMNMRENVLYGEDYQILVRIPDYDADASYVIDINKARVNQKDTTNMEVVKSVDLPEAQIYTNSTIKMSDLEVPALQLVRSEGKFTYALVRIPNAELANSVYNLVLRKKDADQPLAKKVVRSYWPDIPPSLLSLDISIDMMKFILPEDALKQMKKGSAKEKEQKFRDFWTKRDPTPDTEYNELMTEYYRRVHYAFMEYRNPENPFGQETDQGEVYIKYGPPNSRDRVFPKKGQVIETWVYDNRSFVFEKGAGFSEFVLLGK